MREGFGSWAGDNASEESIRVLHVDDEIDFSALASDFLERESEAFEILTEHSASDGLERLSNEHVDCIVSDYQMPGRNGLGFFEQVSEANIDIPFILFTGQGSEDIASEAFTRGVTDYFQKEMGTDQFTVLANRIELAVSNHRSEKQVKRTRRRFKTLVEESNDAILVVDTSGTILYATPATQHILGKEPATIIGTDGFEPVHPDDVETVQQELATLVTNPEHEASVEFRYRHADGSWVWLEARGRNLLQNADIAGIVVYVRDVDERKADELELENRERKFRAVFEGAFDAMVIADDDGVYVDANPAACDLFGLPKDELVGRSIEEFAPEDFDFEAAWRDFQESHGERGNFELVRPDGDTRVVEFAAAQNILPHHHLSILREVSIEG